MTVFMNFKLRKLHVLLALCFLVLNIQLFAQSASPQVINTTGGSGTDAIGNIWDFSIGEPIVLSGGPGPIITSGVIQPLATCGVNRIYVDASAGGSADGTSWTDAYNDFNEALNFSNTCNTVKEIWVAGATYNFPTSFMITRGVSIIGGFPPGGGAGTIGDQEYWTYPTVFTVDPGGVEVFNIAAPETDTVSLYGITVDGMNNNHNIDAQNCKLHFESSRFINSFGLFMNYVSHNTEPTIINILNSEVSNFQIPGGGTAGAFLFEDNNGGGEDSIFIIASTFHTMEAGAGASSIFRLRNAGQKNIRVENSIIWAPNNNGSDVNISGGQSFISNSVSFNPGDYDFTLGPIDNGDPMVIDENFSNNVRLSPGSGAIDLGLDLTIKPLPPFDLDGNPRKLDVAPDAGAYETGCNPLIVTTLVDNAASPFCGDLRFAVQFALGNAGMNHIEFDNGIFGGTIPFDEFIQIPGGVGKVHIDGDINNDGEPDIILDGAVLSNGNEAFDVTGNGNIFEGLVINRFLAGITVRGDSNLLTNNYIGIDITGSLDGALYENQDGIRVGGANNTIQNSVISGNTSIGISFDSPQADDNLVIGNKIGTSADGLSRLDNYEGIRFTSGNRNTIGLEGTGNRNIISGNGFGGIIFWDGNIGNNTDSNYIYNNYIGVDINGLLPLGNGWTNGPGGIDIQGSSRGNKIGDIAIPARGNVISGNSFRGAITMNEGPPAGQHFDHIIANNFIGVGADGVTIVDSSGGIFFGSVGDLQIVNNVIVGHQLRITGASADNSIIHGNQIYGNNGAPGIDLDVGANANIFPPKLLSLNMTDSLLSGTSVAGEQVQLFADSADEGYYHIATFTPPGTSWTIKIDPSTFPIGGLNYLTAIGDSLGRSSEFSAPFEILLGCDYEVQNTNEDGNGSLRKAIKCANVEAGPQTITFAGPLAGQTIEIDSSYRILDAFTTIQGLAGLTIRPTDGVPTSDMFEVYGDNFVLTDIQLSGFDASAVQQIDKGIDLQSNNSRIENVTFRGFIDQGIEVDGDRDSLINIVASGGNTASVGFGNNSSNSIIQNSFIGTDATGNALGDPNPWLGMYDIGINNVIGGVGSGNVIVSDSVGLYLIGQGTQVINNNIGVNASGNATLGAGSIGIQVSDEFGAAHSITIGDGTDPGRNVIGGFNIAGIWAASPNGFQGDLAIMMNSIGTDAGATLNLANRFGIFLTQGADTTLIRSNFIDNNYGGGIRIDSVNSVENIIDQNSFKNNAYGIKFNVNSQRGISKPVITGYNFADSTVSGTNGNGATNIQLYAGTDGQGDIYIASFAPAGATWSYSLSTVDFGNIGALDSLYALQDSAGNTSEFSDGFLLDPCNPFLVTETTDNDIVNGECGDLRFAIIEANKAGIDTIRFDPSMDGLTITPMALLPSLTGDNTVIIGDRDLDCIPNVTIDGVTAAGTGFEINGCNGCVVSGLAIIRFDPAIHVTGASLDNELYGNYIGIAFDETQFSMPAANGILLDGGSKGTTVGDSAGCTVSNVIVGNQLGLFISTSDSNTLINNYIGVLPDVTTSYGNNDGVRILTADHNMIGSGTAAGMNVI